MSAHTINDEEFGDIAIRRSPRSKHIRLTVDGRGQVRLSLPPLTPLFLAKQFLNESRTQLRHNIQKFKPNNTILSDGDIIGKTHRLVINREDTYKSRLVGTQLFITLPVGVATEDAQAQKFIHQACIKALRTQAKAYLTRRLAALAAERGFTYDTVRFSNAGTRWGSCSTRGTISLNIWLMQLPFELIDYVIVHELCHTRHMNHSPTFWSLVESIVPDHKARRRELKQFHPYA